jgi:pseudaminic acid cytidylyltransferase
MKFAIIPARGGSKRIPGKNIKDFAGKPLIAYSIKAAVDSGLFEKVIVSTDSEEIADISRKHGAEVPFFRPTELSDDFTPTQKVLTHAVEFFANQGEDVEAFCCIYPTAPMISSKFIAEAFDKLKSSNADTVFSVTSFPYPIFRAYKINDQGNVEMFWPEHELTRSNDLPEAYHDAGQFYWLNAKRFLDSGRMIPKNSVPFLLPRYLVQDIDTPEDWETAELLYSICHQKGLI